MKLPIARARQAPRGTAALLAGLGLMAGSASAQQTNWTNPVVGDWFISSNWDLGVPQSGSFASIDNGGLALVSGPGASALWLQLHQGSHIDVSGTGTLTLGALLEVDIGTMQILGGAKVFQLDSAVPGLEGGTRIGSVGGIGKLFVKDAGSYLSTGGLNLAGSVLSIESGARVDSRYNAFASSSTATITGANSSWSIGGYLMTTGNTASLTVSNRGTVNTGHAYLSGSAVVAGVGSSFNSAGQLQVGGSSVGMLNVQSGAIVRSATADLGFGTAPTPGNGTATVSGAGSAWVNSGLIVIGGIDSAQTNYAGTGTVSVSSGGLLSTASAIIGNQAAAFGTVMIEGAGSKWNNSGDIVVANAGIGMLSVTNGAKLISNRGHVGLAAGSNGSVTVSDPGSSWTAAGSFFIGNGGTGNLNVLNGAVASTAGNSYLGFAAGSQGFATVSGAGSTWNMTAPGTNLNIGGSQLSAGGFGSLGIDDGGTVNTSATNLYSTGMLGLSSGATFTGPITAFGGVIRTGGAITLASTITLKTGGLVVDTLTGSNATFSANIEGPGGLTKRDFIGATKGTLILTGSNTYLGPTVVDSGTVLVNGSNASAVTVNSGKLGGSGVVFGAVVIGNDTGSADATLAPGQGVGTLATGDLTLRTGGVYAVELDSAAAAADRVVVTGSVTLAAGASFSFGDLGASVLAPRSSFVVIDNDGADAIVGQFIDLADGSVFSFGLNRYQASYFGGTGNDLVLSVVPEPASGALLLAGLAGLAGFARINRHARHLEKS